MKMRYLAAVIAAAVISAISVCAAPSAEMPQEYVPVLEMYRTAVEEHWDTDWDKLEANGIPIEFGYGGVSPDIATSLMDIDEDGVPELFIYDRSVEATLFAGYTVRGGEAARLFTGAARNRWRLICCDGRMLLENDGSSSAFDGFNFCYTLKDGHLSFVLGVFYDERAADADRPRGPWFETTVEPDFSRPDYWRVGREISEDAATLTIRKFEAGRYLPQGDPAR